MKSKEERLGTQFRSAACSHTNKVKLGNPEHSVIDLPGFLTKK